MSDSSKPFIVIIDNDNLKSLADRLTVEGRVEAVYRHPLDVRDSDLRRATLLAVDEKFDLRGPVPEDVEPLPEDLPPSTVPGDGLALAAVLRSAAKDPELGRERPIGITLRTGALHELTGHLPHAVRQPVVASQHDLEWVLTKEPDTREVGVGTPTEQLVALALALHRYPSEWSPSTVREVGLGWLAVPVTPWADVARRQILQSRPPAKVSSDAAHGLSWLRWLTTVILPYPTFLIAESYVAAALGVTPASLRVALQGDSDIAVALADCRYSGPLSELQAPRYWRAGVTALVNSLVGEDDLEETRVVGAEASRVDPLLESADLDEPVVAIDADYYAHIDLIERTSARRLAPDYWPAFADAAWTDVESANEPDMADLLAPKTR